MIDFFSFFTSKKSVIFVFGFSTGSAGQYIFKDSFYDPSTGLGSRDFELHESEQTNVVLRILAYSGIIIEDPSIVQLATQQVQGKEANKKSSTMEQKKKWKKIN